MKQTLSWLLALILALGCLSPALAAKDPTEGFSDVDPDAWYAPYVDICVEEGLMEGVGDGRFDPQGQLTQAQAVTLALRIHQRRSGGDGVLPEAPEEWGRMTLTFEDGEVWPCYQADGLDDYRNGWYFGGRFQPELYFSREEGWAGKDYQRATLDFGGQASFSGSVHFAGFAGSRLSFAPESPAGGTEEYFQLLDAWSGACLPGPDKWWRGTAYYREQAGLSGVYALRPYDGAAQREDLLEALSAVSQGLLEPINAIDSFPDADATYAPAEDVLAFYRAGILTGIDEYGSFAGSLGLTRAETAAMAARLLRPELRVSFQLKEPGDYVPYTLTELPVPEGFVRDTSWAPAQSYLLMERPGDAGQAQAAVLRADGTWLSLDGCYVGGWEEFYHENVDLVLLHKNDPTLWGSTGVMDLTTGEMALPFGHYGTCQVLPGNLILTRWDNFSPTEPYRLYDKAGREIAQLYDTAEWRLLSDGLAPRYDEASGLWGYVDLNDQWVIPPQSGSYWGFQGGYVTVSRETDGQWHDGVLDAQGREVLPFQYENLEHRGDGLFLDDRDGNSRWVELDGTETVNRFLPYQLYRSNGYIAFGGCYLDRDFRQITDQVFDWTGPIGPDKSGFVGKDGKIYRIEFAQ